MRPLTLSIMAIIAVLEISCTKQTKELNYDAGIKAYERGHYQVAMYEFEPRAIRGDSVAQYYLAKILLEQNKFREAENWYAKVTSSIYSNFSDFMNYPGDIDRDHAEAQYRLGEMYWNEGLKANLDSAKYWYKRAADRTDGNKDIGHAEAQYKLSLMYLVNANAELKKEKQEDIDMDRIVNLALFLPWLERAINRGHVKAQYLKGYIYYSDRWDHVRSRKPENLKIWMFLQSDIQPMLDSLKSAYPSDPGLKPISDDLDSLKSEFLGPEHLFLISRDLNSKEIENIIKPVKDLKIENLIIPEKDFEKAEEWYEKAAYQGSYIAQNALAKMYDNCIRLDDHPQQVDSSQVQLSDPDQEYHEHCKQLSDEIKKKKAEKMIRLYLEGAQQGHSASQFDLGRWFEAGLKYDDGKVFIKQNS